MPRIDLNIVDRGTNGTKWIAENTGLTAEHLDKVKEKKTDNSGALNSLPTPFARFFVAREAFRRVTDDHIHKKQEAGYAYRQLVSDILDVYEVLFNINYHRNTWNNKEKLEIREWESDKELANIKVCMPILYNSLANYYHTDIKEEKLFFIVYTENGKDLLLASSSPITGFVTPPDMDKTKNSGNPSFAGEQYKGLYIRRKSGSLYFRDIEMFEDRDPDFKNYMFQLFDTDNVNEKYKEIHDYIKSFNITDKDIKKNYNLKLKTIKTDQNNDLIINGLTLKSSDEIDIYSYFTPTLIQLPYRISTKNFKTIIYQNDIEGRNYDFLLPFKPEILELLEREEIKYSIKENRNSFTVFLTYKDKTYKKEYNDSPSGNEGRIKRLGTASISFDIGIFPNILSCNVDENNYFKILVVAADEDPEAPNFNIDQISLSFFGKDLRVIEEVEETSAQFGVMPAVVRSRQTGDMEESGTKFYELFNTVFNAIEVNIMGDTGLLIPEWQKSTQSNATFTYAIDLGTSNTFISQCSDEDNTPEMFKMEKPIVNYLHEISDSKQFTLARNIEDSIFEKAKRKIKTEFLPAFIDGKEYKFPIRTAMCYGTMNLSREPRLFDNHNIAFFYERLRANEDQKILTDIKWKQKEAQLRIFIRELLLIIKCDILQRNGDISKTNLVWFRPLSFMGNIRRMYQDIWFSEAKDILFLQQSNIRCFSESEAPYYYFKKKDYIKDSDAATVIDIGGGSTDFVYFKDNQPLIANSVHFGCDVLWENGFKEFKDEKQNGIYNKYKDKLHFKKSQELEDLNTDIKEAKGISTKDIINFWLGNEEHCDIKKSLNADFKPLFVYHFTSILFYMASMYKDYELDAPKTVVFSGSGSKYIDSFIWQEHDILKQIIGIVFKKVFGGEHNIHLELPPERKEATCYGGLYRASNAPDVPEKTYHGYKSLGEHATRGEIDSNFKTLEGELLKKYAVLQSLYKEVLYLLKKQGIIDNDTDTNEYVNLAEKEMRTPLNTYYQSQVKERNKEDDTLYDSIFFLPIIDRIFEMTKL